MHAVDHRKETLAIDRITDVHYLQRYPGTKQEEDGAKRWRAAYAYGLSHLLFSLELYAIQIKEGRYMLHEHPLSASSWRVPEVVEFMTMHGLTRVRGDMCCFNMVQKDDDGWALIKKPTGYMCNSLYIRSELERKCEGGHRHIPLMSGRAKAAQVYPDELCHAILRGLRKQLTMDGVLKSTTDLTILMMEGDQEEKDWYSDSIYFDDVSGKWLDNDLVAAARKEEMEVFKQHNVYTKVPLEECLRVTGKKPIGCRWIDTDKGDDDNPEYRSRLVAKEIKRDVREEMFAATPPLDAKKALVSLAVSKLNAGCGDQGTDKLKLVFIDVRRAYFYADATRSIYVELPEEDKQEGFVGRLNKAMYGTRDAAANWERCFTDHLVGQGFLQGVSSPCVFWHAKKLIRLVVHGDDFTFLAPASQAKWCEDMMKISFDIKMRGIVGTGKDDTKVIRILNRCLEVVGDELHYEADPRHA